MKYSPYIVFVLIVFITFSPCIADEWMMYCTGELYRYEQAHSYLGEHSPEEGYGEYFLREIVLPEGGMYRRLSYTRHSDIDELSDIPNDEIKILKLLCETLDDHRNFNLCVQTSDRKDSKGMRYIEALCFLLYDMPWGVPSYIYEPYNFLSEKKTNIFNLLAKLPKLRHLELYSFILSDRRFSEIGKLPNLEYLGLPQLSKDENLKHLAGLTKLKYINASGTRNIKGSGLKYLSKLPNLRTLDMRCNKLDREAFMLLKSFKSLETLLLSASSVTDEDLEFISSMENLKYITLHYTDITDGGLKYLSQLKALRYVSLHNTKTTKAGHTLLKQNHPDLKLDVEPLRNFMEFFIDLRHVMAQIGDAGYQRSVASLYSTGVKYTPKDYVESLKWYIVCSKQIEVFGSGRKAEILEKIKYLKSQLSKYQIKEAEKRARVYLYLQERCSYNFEIERQEGLPVYQYDFDTID